jgi:hypothetical protein
MKIITIDTEGKEQVVVSDETQKEGEHINLFPMQGNFMVVACGTDKDYTLNKRKTTIIFDRPGERNMFNKYITMMKNDCKEKRSYYKFAEKFYDNFYKQVATKEEIVPREVRQIDIVDSKEAE